MRQFFEWDQSKYSVCVQQMDVEHKIIIACMNRLHDLYEAGVTGPKIVKVVAELGDVTVKHFAHEEAYMQEIAFPERVNHSFIHKQLLANFALHQKRVIATGTITEEFFTFLKTWLRIHICGIDMKYGHYRQAA